MKQWVRNVLGPTFDGVSREEVRTRIYRMMRRPHCAMMIAIMAFEFVMLFAISYPDGPFTSIRRTRYAALYLILLLVTAAALVFHRYMTEERRNAAGRYFAMYHAYIVLINLWGIAITLNDQLGGNGLTVYTYVTLITAVFFIAPLWKCVALYLGSCVLLNLLLPFFPNPQGLDHRFNNWANSLAVAGMAIILSVFFYRVQVMLRRSEIIMEQQNRQLHQLNEQLRMEIMTDPLTQLHNRRYLREIIVPRLTAAGQGPMACMMADIDHFKRYNDRYGHVQGDRLLQRLARFLEDGESGLDVVRYGGEEFALFLYGDDARDALARAERLVRSLEALGLEHPDNPGGRVTISIGVRVGGGPSDDAADMIAQADQALYEAKQTGRNRAVLYRDAGTEKQGIPVPLTE